MSEETAQNATILRMADKIIVLMEALVRIAVESSEGRIRGLAEAALKEAKKL